MLDCGWKEQIDGMLSPTGLETTPFKNLASKVAGLQVHATTPSKRFAVDKISSQHSSSRN